MKLYLYIRTDYVEEFLKKEFRFALRISDQKPEVVNRFSDDIPCGSVDVEIDVDEKEIRQIAAKRLDDAISKVRAESEMQVQGLEQRKQNLLALEHIK